MKDFFGRELKRGNIVAYAVERSCLRYGVIESTEVKVRECYRGNYNADIIKISRPEHVTIRWNRNELRYDEVNEWETKTITMYSPGACVIVDPVDLSNNGDKPWLERLLDLKNQIDNKEA